MMKENYSYPDAEDKLTTDFIRINEPYRGYWQKSENSVLSLGSRYIESCTQNTDKPILLDAGCGDGRLLGRYSKYFKKIVAIDPDRCRLEKAQESVRIAGFSRRVTFIETSIESYEAEDPIDVILCSHVLQHVGRKSFRSILGKFRDVLKKKGLLLILTTHSRAPNGTYSKSFCDRGQLVEEEISSLEFDGLISNRKGILPIRFFSLKEIRGYLNDAGFDFLESRVFHLVEKRNLLQRFPGRDRMVNLCPIMKKKRGRDIFLVARSR